MTAEVGSAVGMFGDPAPVIVCRDFPAVLRANGRIGEAADVVTDGQDQLVSHQLLVHEAEGDGVRHLMDDRSGLVRLVGAMEDLRIAEGPVLGLVGLDGSHGAGLPAPGVVDEELGVDAEEVVEKVLVQKVIGTSQGAPRNVSHGEHAVGFQFLDVTCAYAPEVPQRSVGPEPLPVSHLVQLGDPHAVGVRFLVLGQDVHGDLGQVEVGPDAGGGCNTGLLIDLQDHLLSQLPP